MASEPFSYSRDLRLLSKEQFSAALRARPFERSALFTCHWCRCLETDSTGKEQPKLGFIIPKRLARLSVRRNAIKRVLRESFRHYRLKLAGGYYVFRLKAPPPASSLTNLKRMVREQADSILAKAVTYK